MVDVFRIPNAQDISAGLRFGARWFELDTKIIGASAGGFNGVVSGGEVTEAAIPDMTVDVAAPRCVFNGVATTASPAMQVHSDADATFPRIDVIVLQGPGPFPELGHYEGTPAESPVPPDVPGVELGTEVVLAYVLIPAGDTAITQDQIIPKAIPVEEPFVSGADWTTLIANDEATAGTRSSNASLTPDSMLAFEMAASTTYRIRARVEFDARQASGVKAGFTGPAIGAGRIRMTSWPRPRQAGGIAGTSISELTHNAYDATGRPMTLNAATFLGIYELEGTIRNGATTGDFAIAWAQVTAVAESTMRLDGSYLEYLTL